MRLLLDTNVFLEVFLEQEKAPLVQALLSRKEAYEFYISDYTLHSIGVILFRYKHYRTFMQFLDDMVFNRVIEIVALPAHRLKKVIEVAQHFRLDFDDAYQYVIADHYSLDIVSFDRDFDRSPKGRILPENLWFENR